LSVAPQSIQHLDLLLNRLKRQPLPCHFSQDSQSNIGQRGFGRTRLRIRSFDSSSNPAPHIQFPGGIEASLIERKGLTDAIEQSAVTHPGDRSQKARARTVFTLSFASHTAVYVRLRAAL